MSALLADLWGALEPHVAGTHLEPLLQLPPGGLLNGHPAKQIGDAVIWVPADAERRDSGCGSVGSRPSTAVASESSDEAPLINVSGDDPRGSEKGAHTDALAQMLSGRGGPCYPAYVFYRESV